MTINMPCVGCVDLNLKRPWVISCDISSEHRSMHIYRTITEWAEQQAELGVVPANECWTSRKAFDRVFVPAERSKGEFKRHRRINDANGVYRKKNKKTFDWSDHVYQIRHKDSSSIVVLCKLHELDGLSCLNIDLLGDKALFKKVGHQ